MRLSKARLDKLVEEAIVDCYDESEQVTVERVQLTSPREIVAVCRRAGIRQTVPLVDLPLPSPRPAGSDWIAAYRHWLRGS